VLQYLALALGVVVLSVGAPLAVTIDRLDVWLALLLCLVQAAAVALAPRFPRASVWAGALVLGPLSWAALPTSGGPWPVSATSIVAFILTLSLASLRVRWTQLVAPSLAALLIATVRIYDNGPTRPSPGPLIADLVTFSGLVALTLLTAALARNWSEVRAALARERTLSAEEAAGRRVAEERTRIARELHDVVAHGLSSIQVQASSARYRLPGLPTEAAAEFDDIAATSRRAMGEMRGLLAVLRGGEDAEGAPQPGLGELRALVAGVPHAERVSLAVDVARPQAVPASVALSAYRMVQEALSNTVRHAPGAAVTVKVAHDDAGPALRVSVANGAPPAPGGAAGPAASPGPAAPAGGGHGLVGMRERALLHGGSFDAGALPSGGFLVTARLPYTPLPSPRKDAP
jgi:signal transduction histidine kinase